VAVNSDLLLLFFVKVKDSFSVADATDAYDGVHEVKTAEICEVVHISKEESEFLSAVINGNHVARSFFAFGDFVLSGDDVKEVCGSNGCEDVWS